MSIKGLEHKRKDTTRQLKSKTKGTFFDRFYVIPIYDAYVDQKKITLTFYDPESLEVQGETYDFPYNDRYCMSIVNYKDK